MDKWWSVVSINTEVPSSGTVSLRINRKTGIKTRHIDIGNIYISLPPPVYTAILLRRSIFLRKECKSFYPCKSGFILQWGHTIYLAKSESEIQAVNFHLIGCIFPFAMRVTHSWGVSGHTGNKSKLTFSWNFNQYMINDCNYNERLQHQMQKCQNNKPLVGRLADLVQLNLLLHQQNIQHGHFKILHLNPLQSLQQKLEVYITAV